MRPLSQHHQKLVRPAFSFSWPIALAVYSLVRNLPTVTPRASFSPVILVGDANLRVSRTSPSSLQADLHRIVFHSGRRQTRPVFGRHPFLARRVAKKNPKKSPSGTAGRSAASLCWFYTDAGGKPPAGADFETGHAAPTSTADESSVCVHNLG